ncbi:alpha-L-rhamnosidase-related protein [Thermophagus sp. OGC60D27]|uniref:alpha-L-rhamnosidase-related protein n=1 Tax=Thermophagus sp. OGC60D27 TaxID=3458415 RepID=UPI0040384600
MTSFKTKYPNKLGKFLLLLVPHFLFQTFIANAQFTDWKANWIWTSQKGPNNTWVDIRKKIHLDSQPSTAIARIAAENKYWLFINDSLVVNDGGLEVRPDLNNTYYDEIDLAPFLHAGENIICALVWHKGGPECYTQRMLADGGFLFDMQLTGTKPQRVVSDKTWKIRVDSAFLRGAFRYKYNVTGSILFSNDPFGGDPTAGVEKAGYHKPAGSTGPWIRCARENETFTLSQPSDVAYGNSEEPLKQWNDNKWLAYPVTFDARIGNSDWHQLSFDDSEWSFASEKGVPPVAPWNQLKHRTIPFFKDHGLKPFLNEAAFPTHITKDTVIVGKLALNIQGTPYLKVKAPAGVNIRMTLNDFYYQDYITREGLQAFECLAWQNSSQHKVEYHFTNVTDEVEIIELKFRQTSYNTEFIGSFHSNDENLNTLWEKCRNTSLVCMRDYFYDCPDRERGQWWGDVSEQILYSFYLYDQESTKMAKKAYRELMYTQKEDGSLYTTAPGKAFNLPDQNIAAVALFWKYYLYTGDKALIEELYPYAKKFVQKCASTANEDGMLILEKSAGWNLWNWIDWGNNRDVQDGSANTICNAMYIHLLSSMINIAEVIGKTSDINYYEALRQKVQANFDRYFWRPEGYVFGNKDGIQSEVIDDRSNAWAVIANMVGPDKKEKVLEVLKTKYNASPYQEMYVELAMIELDATETLHRIRNRFSEMISSWSSTLWEEFPAKNSNNHAWSAGPVYLLGGYYLGIKPIKPGYLEFEFMPNPGDLTSISGSVPSPQGKITAGIEVAENGQPIAQHIIVPNNSVCIMGIPKSIGKDNISLENIRVNSKKFLKKRKAFAKKGVQFYEETDAYIKFKLLPGDWSFSVNNPKGK